MATVIGLMSGKEFVVEDKSYRLLKNDGSIIYVFISQDQKRLITVEESNIEFFNESNTSDRIDDLEKLMTTAILPEKIGAEYV